MENFKPVEGFSDVELGLLVGAEYQKKAQAEANITAINQELAKRQGQVKEKKEEKK